MKRTLLLLFLLCAISTTQAQTPKDPATKSPLAASNSGKQRFEGEFCPPGGKLISIEVNVGRKYGGPVVRGFRFIGEDATGKRVETVIGPVDGKYEKAIEPKQGVDVVGISGKHGLVIDSIRFHFSDGSVSPLAGGTGGSEEYKMLVREKDGKYRGRVRGLFGRANEDSLTGVGLLLLGRDGVPAELNRPDTLELTIRGEVDAEFAPTVGRLTALYYECYPALLKRFDNPKKPASRQITLIFKRNMRVPAYCSGSEISVSIEWLKQHPEDIALLTHELTHAVQGYPVFEPSWMVEGIADYARHLYGPKQQANWKLPETLTPKQSYKDSYRTTGKFLVWLDAKHPGVVDKLHQHLQSREFSITDFKEMTGKTVEALWEECVAELSKKK